MEARPERETSCGALVDLLSTDLGRDRVELKPICRTGLGVREAGSRACTKSSFRCVVRLVRHSWNITFYAKRTEFRSLKRAVTCYENVSRNFGDDVIQ